MMMYKFLIFNNTLLLKWEIVHEEWEEEYEEREDETDEEREEWKGNWVWVCLGLEKNITN